MHVYIGTYTEEGFGRAEGIGLFDFDPERGVLTSVATFAGIANPSFLTASADGRFIYAVNELAAGRVTAFARDPQSGALTELNSVPTHGAHPCFLALDAASRHLLVTNYTGGSVAVVPIAPDGSLMPASTVVHHASLDSSLQRPGGPHPHMIASDPTGTFVIATDLGVDQVVIYRLDSETGTLTRDGQIATAPGAGPRHFAFSPDGRNLYVINELDSTITAYSYAAGVIEPLSTRSTLPAGFDLESSCAHLVVAPDGRFVYGSNRGHDSIAIFAVDAENGDFTPLGHQSSLGQVPRNFALDPSGRWLLVANQESDTIVIFRRDPDGGGLTPHGEPVATPSAVSILFIDPADEKR